MERGEEARGRHVGMGASAADLVRTEGVRALGATRQSDSGVGMDSDALEKAARVIAVIEGLRQELELGAPPKPREAPVADLAGVEEERDRMARELEQTKAQLEEAVRERESLTEQLRRAEENFEELQRQNLDLGREVSALEEKLRKWARFVGQFP